MNKWSSAADIIIDKLLDEGVHILRYDSYTSNSIYIKMDYGIAHSLRISDHTGKKSLAYRFNLLSNVKERELQLYDGLERHYFPIHAIQDVVDRILEQREWKITVWGKARYRAAMEESRLTNLTNKKGFWLNARPINRRKV